MKTLLLLRHAKSSWSEPLDDHDRPLSGRGRRAARAMGELLADRALQPDRVLLSTSRRTSETWGLMAPLLGRPTEVASQGLYLAPAGQLLQAVREAPGAAEVLLLIGHNPGIEDLARSLAGGGDPEGLRRLHKKFPTGALAVLDFPSEAWSDVAPGSGELVSFVRPKDLPESKRFEG